MPPPKNHKRVSFYIPNELWEDIQRASKQTSLPMSMVLRKGVERARAYYEEYGELLGIEQNTENDVRLYFDTNRKCIMTEKGSYVAYIGMDEMSKRLVASWNKCLAMSLEELEK